MSSHTEEERELLREVAEELSFDIGDKAVISALDTAATLDETAEHLYADIEPNEGSVGSLADDEYNSLLELYDEPRIRTRTGTDDGALDGLTVAIKDVIAVRGLTLTCASKNCSFVPSFDATVVDRLLDAGAGVVGKANCDAFAFGPTGEFSEFGRVINPAAEDRVPGGSSSGSGAAVAGEIVDIALGTDTGGSIRIPAACCGVVGVKPTHRLVPRTGFVDLAPSTDTIGPLARDVETATKALEAIAGPDPGDPSASHADMDGLAMGLDDHGGLTFGVPTAFLEVASDDVRGVLRDVMAMLDDLRDVSVREIELDLGAIDSAYPLTIATEFAWLLRQAFVTRGQGTQYDEGWQAGLLAAEFNEHVALRVLPAAYLDARTNGASYVAGRREAISFKRRVNELFREVDLLLTPTMRILPPTYGAVTATEGMEDISGNTGPFSLTGLPGVSLPAGEVDGVPVAAQVIAPDFEDGRALRGARVIEKHVA